MAISRSSASNSIPLVDPWFPAQYAERVRDQVLSGHVGPGAVAQAFQQGLAAFVGAHHCVLTTSGTVALSVAAKALGLVAGDEVLVPAYGVISTINGFASIGLRPRLVDIERATGCMSPASLQERISPRTKAVCFVNFSGYTGENVVEVARLCEAKGVPLIEDAACAFGHRYGDRFAGTFGNVGTYSFSVPKIVTTGQGGALVTNNSRTFERAAAFVDQGDLEWRKTNLNREIGTNLRFTDIQAALGLCQLTDMDARLQRRRETYGVLRHQLGPSIFAVPGPEAPLHNIVFTREPDMLVATLKAQGIAALRQYRTISQHPAYADLADAAFPNSDYWTAHAVYLPFGMNLSVADAQRIGAAVSQFSGSLESIGQ